VLAIALVVLAACTPAPERRPNVLLIVADTLRADRLSAKRGDVSLTPFLDELAARGCVFRRAYATSSWTQPSVASLFTSRYPSQHGVVGHASKLAEAESTLAEVLSLHGYATAGFSANFLLHRRRGWGQGFQQYTAYHPLKDVPDTEALPVRAETLNVAALAWLEQRPRKKPFFLFLQYMEPHSPYVPPEWALARLGPPPADEPPLGHLNAFARYGNLALEAIDDATLAALERHYDASVLALDAALRTFFDTLEARGLLADTLVVVTADHGEEMKEHQLFGHGQTLYETLVRVPLVIVPPAGQAHCEAVEERVSLLDLAPTILELVGLPPARVFEGRSLAGVVSGEGPPARDVTIVTELLRPEGYPRLGRHVHALIADDRKIIADLDGREEFYDLSRDPGERDTEGLSAAEREALQRELASVVERLGAHTASRPAEELDEETRRHLEALGYLERDARETEQ
jgi:arylsulfatase A-like enzyme